MFNGPRRSQTVIFRDLAAPEQRDRVLVSHHNRKLHVNCATAAVSLAVRERLLEEG